MNDNQEINKDLVSAIKGLLSAFTTMTNQTQATAVVFAAKALMKAERHD